MVSSPVASQLCACRTVWSLSRPFHLPSARSRPGSPLSNDLSFPLTRVRPANPFLPPLEFPPRILANFRGFSRPSLPPRVHLVPTSPHPALSFPSSALPPALYTLTFVCPLRLLVYPLGLCPLSLSLPVTRQLVALVHSPFTDLLTCLERAGRPAGDRVPYNVWQVTRGPPAHPPFAAHFGTTLPNRWFSQPDLVVPRRCPRGSPDWALGARKFH